MSHAVTLGAQITDIVLVYLHRDGGPSHDGDAMAFQSHPLGGVVAHQIQGADTQVIEDLCAGAELAGICRQAEGQVGIDGIGASS